MAFSDLGRLNVMVAIPSEISTLTPGCMFEMLVRPRRRWWVKAKCRMQDRAMHNSGFVGTCVGRMSNFSGAVEYQVREALVIASTSARASSCSDPLLHRNHHHHHLRPLHALNFLSFVIVKTKLFSALLWLYYLLSRGTETSSAPEVLISEEGQFPQTQLWLSGWLL